MSKNTQFLTQALSGQAWAIKDSMLDHLQQLAASGKAMQAMEETVTPEVTMQKLPLVKQNGRSVGLVTFHGVVINRCPEWATYYGYLSPQTFAREIRQLADDPTVTSIVVSIDSPGGTVAGTVEAAEAVIYARSKKRVTAVVNDMACSAAYWVAAQCSEIVVSPTALTGSIGVIISHMDYSKALNDWGVVATYIRSAVKKALGQPYEPLSDVAKAEFQAMVDAVYAQFITAVAKGRRKARTVVAEQWASGEVWTGADAIKAGLADRVGTMSTIIGEQTGAVPLPEPSPPPPPDDEEDPEARASPPPASSADAEQNASLTEDPPAPTEAGSSIPISAPQAQEEQTMNIKDILAKVQAGQALTAEERNALNAHLDSQGSGTPAANVDLSQLSPEARAIVESAQAEAAAARQEAQTAQTTANTERDNRLNREFSERAVALGQPAAFGATLRSASEKLSAEEYTALEQSLNATGAQQKLLSESGSSKDNRDSGNVQADYRTRVAAHIKANPGTSRADAGRAVLAADPAFAQRYR
ncbi:S49 family peptidase, partial [Deinococcus radiopugnans]|uniref:S49 family peptidase n=1 Tax=Deinococcus radiopugnans TaxID=57497 RepID=UPI00361EC3CF